MDTATQPEHRQGDRLRREIGSVWALAWPMIVTNMLNVLVGVVDFKMVGSLGISSIAAVGMAQQVMMFLMVLMIAISGGSSILVAHAYGAGDRARVTRIASRSMAMMVVAALVLVTPAGILFSRPLLMLLGGDEDVVHLGASYLYICFWGSVVTMFNFAVTGVLLGVGKTKISLGLLIVVNGLNVVLNFLFIFGAGPIPAFGVRGAAMGTIGARAIGSVLGLWIAAAPRFQIQATWRESLVFDMPLLLRILHLGGPRSLQGIVRNFSRLMTIRIITLLPDATRAVSAYSVGMQVRMTATFVGLAFMSASMARVGHNLGGADPDSAERSGWISATMAALIMGMVAIVFLIFPEEIMGFFTSDRNVIALGRTFFITIAVTEPVMAFAFGLSGALRGGGDPISPFVYASLSDLVVVTLAGYLLAIPLHMGFSGIALGMAVSSITRAVPVTLKFRQGKWKSNRL